jgi:hypothetical protein
MIVQLSMDLLLLQPTVDKFEGRGKSRGPRTTLVVPGSADQRWPALGRIVVAARITKCVEISDV